MLLVCGPDEYLSPLNPAAALGIMFQQVYNGNADGFKYIYVYLPFPFLGGLIAVFFYEKVYKRVQEAIDESENSNAGGILDEEDSNIQNSWVSKKWIY